MSPILQKMTECLEFMKRHGAGLKVLEHMEEAVLWQKMEEDLAGMVEMEGPGGHGDRPSHRETP